MTERKFTPPTEFPAEYVDGSGDKAVILGRGPNEKFPFIGYDADEDAVTWTERGEGFPEEGGLFDLHDIPEVTAELERAEARIEALEGKLSMALDVLLEAVEPSVVEKGEADTEDYHDAWREVEIAELEAKLAKAAEALGGMVGLFSGYSLLLKGMHLNMELDNARTTLAELKGQDDE